jgi:ssDNA-binding Zn-finger/Zn-ribbon topoisomerase 1
MNDKTEIEEKNKAVGFEPLVMLPCPYCGGKIELKDSSIIYGRSYGNVYICENYPKCDAFVGTHHGKTKPLGTLADSRLRNKRKETHSLFDQLWRGENRKMHRRQAYKFMADIINIKPERAHIAMLTYEECNKLIGELLRARQHNGLQITCER